MDSESEDEGVQVSNSDKEEEEDERWDKPWIRHSYWNEPMESRDRNMSNLNLSLIPSAPEEQNYKYQPQSSNLTRTREVERGVIM